MKRSLVVGLVLLAAGLFFYLSWDQVGAPVTPATGAPTSTASAATTSPQTAAPAAPEPQTAEGPRVQIGTLTVPVELARTSAQVTKGLSGRLSLDADKGMLFIFSKPDIYRFWMPDMRFPIDIIWISSAKKVIGVSANVSNDFDPANPKFYTPPAPAQYVLEANAGFAARNGIQIGANVTFAGF